MQTRYLQSFWDRALKEAERSYIEVGAGSTLSWTLSPAFTLSAVADWGLGSGPTQWLVLSNEEKEFLSKESFEWEIQLLSSGLSTTWALGENDLLQATARAEYILFAPNQLGIAGDLDWRASLFYAHRWGAFRAGLGIERKPRMDKGWFEESQWEPLVDLWWRF